MPRRDGDQENPHVGVSNYVSALLREKKLSNVHTIPNRIKLARIQSVVLIQLDSHAK
jgi:hypothetical protein